MQPHTDGSESLRVARERERLRDNRKLVDLAAAVVDCHRLLRGPPAASPEP